MIIFVYVCKYMHTKIALFICYVLCSHQILINPTLNDTISIGGMVDPSSTVLQNCRIYYMAH